MLEGDAGRNAEGVPGGDAGGDEEEFGVGAVIENEAIAKVFLIVAAVVALAAGRGVEGNDAVSGAKGGDAAADLVDSACQLVAERDGGLEHARVIAAAVDLEVGPAGERGVHTHDDLARTGLRHGNLLNAQILAAVENGGCHVRCHRDYCLKDREVTAG